MTAPLAPGVGPFHVVGSDTSALAAETVTDQRPMHEQIADMIVASSDGMTCSDVEERLPHKTHQSVSARIRELVIAGVIYNTGRRRKGASGRTQGIYETVPADLTLFSISPSDA